MSDMVTNPEDFPKAFEHALNSGELESISALYDEAAVIRGGSGEVRYGEAAVRDEMQQLILAKAEIANTLRHTLLHGDVALIIVDYVLHIATSDGSRQQIKGTATNVIQHQVGKGWRMVIANPPGTS